MKTHILLILCVALLLEAAETAVAQTRPEVSTMRGKLWENLVNDGWIGSLAAWDFNTSSPLGLYPGFTGYYHVVGGEQIAYENGGTFENANMHNFRSGVILSAKDIKTPGDPPVYAPENLDYEVFASGLQAATYGVESTLPPIQFQQNYVGTTGFNPLLPEEQTVATWNTNLGITITRRSYTWSYPGYSDFIIYDYTMTNTGLMVSTRTQSLVPNFPQQTISNLFVGFHSGIAVSTKSQINFHSTLDGIAAGGFGWKEGAYHDVYGSDDDGTLDYSYNVNGGSGPAPSEANTLKPNERWKQFFGNELESPSCFGWLALYAPKSNAAKARPRPEAPDYLRIDSHKGGDFPKGQPLDLEKFNPVDKAKALFYRFLQSPDLTGGGLLGNNGDRMNFFTLSYGPYTLAPGQSLRFIIAEIAGVMDYKQVVEGDPNHLFPDASIAAIRANAVRARNAVKWGIGAPPVNGIPLAAAVPVPPPAPACDAVNASIGGDTAAIAVTWDKAAENGQVTDGAGASWYQGAASLQGYRIYRSSDFQFSGTGKPDAFRAAWWDTVATIPASALAQYWDAGINRYRFVDRNVQFGFRYGYYVSAFWTPSTWTSPNGTVVPNPGLVESGPVNKTLPTRAAPGPVTSMDVFVAPNPFVFNDPNRSFVKNGNLYGIEFRNLPESCTIRIYTVMGDLVRTLPHVVDERGNKFGSETWDQKTDSGLLVAPGLYVYNVQSTAPDVKGEFTGKLMIIR